MSSDLWSFSLTTYARPGVERACLQLQSAGVNVCLLLCGSWLGQRGVACNEQRLKRLRDVAQPWDADVVQPLRALRMQWKACATEYAELKKTQPSYTDIFTFMSFDDQIDDKDGLMVKVKRISDNKQFVLPLADLKVTDSGSPNHELIHDYAVWYVNY